MRFPAPGDIFEGRYEIDSVLGSGGFARVYRAKEMGLGRDVALKILRPPNIDSQSDTERDEYLETLMQRFKREAQMLSKLRSPYTVTMYQYGKTQEGLLFMALEFVDGMSLAELLRAETPVEPDRVVRILQQVLSSLKEAHSLGMLHRDLKPANIMIYDHMGERDQVKLLDFGIAKMVGDVSSRRDLTGDGTLIGTPRYMAPEQIQGDSTQIGPPSDIYALGLVAYELLVGARAIQGDSSIQIIGKQLAPESFQLPIQSNCTPSLRAIVNRMMAKSLQARYADVGEILRDLEDERIPLIQIEPVLADVSTGEIEVFDASGNFADFESGIQSNRVPVSAIAAGGAAVLLVVLAIVAFTTGPSQAEDNGSEKAAEPVVAEKPTPKPEPEPEDLRPTKTLVASNMQGVEVLLNGELIGNAPIHVKPDRYPAVITAKLGDETKTETLEEGQPSIVITFDAKAIAAAEKKVKEAEADKPKPRPRPKPKPVKKTPKPSKYYGLE